MNFADQKMVKKLRKEFPVGCRVVLDEMDDRQAPPIGTQGTCNGVDDAGNILVSWDTGSHLNVAYGADSCHRVATDAEYFELLRGGYSDWEFPLDTLKRGLAASIGRAEAIRYLKKRQMM